MAATKSKVVSLQAKRKAGYKSPAARMQQETLRAAWNHGAPWSDEEVSYIAHGIQSGSTVYELALSLGRSYYSTGTARAHVGFALRHMAVLQAAWSE